MTTDTLSQYDVKTPKSQTAGQGSPIIHVGKTNACLNKNLKPGYRESALAHFPIYQTTLRDLLKHIIIDGGAWSPGLHENGHRINTKWIGAETMAFDYDANVRVADLLQSPIVQKHAVAVHPSASSSPECYKSRLIIRLSEMVRDFDHYRAIAAHIITSIGLPADPVSERPAQFFYGSTNRIEQFYANVNATPFDVTTVQVVKRAAQRPIITPISGISSRYGQVALENILADLRSLPTGRNIGANNAARKAYGLKLDGYITTSETELEALLMDCEYANGYIPEHSEHAARASIRSGFKTAAPGKNGRNPRESVPRGTVGTIVPEIAPEPENSAIAEKSADWATMPDAILSAILRNVPTIAPLARIIVKSGLRVFSREQMQAVAKARGMSKGTFDRTFPRLISPEFALLECISSAYIDSKSANYRLLPCICVIEQLRPLDTKWVYRVCHPVGAPPEPGHEDRRKLALPTAEMLRDSGIENAEALATEMQQKTRQYTEKRTLYRAKRVLAQLEASYFDPHETNIPDSSEIHTLAALRTSFLNAYVAEHPGETLPRFEIMRLTGAANSSIKALTVRAGVEGKTPDELPALDIRTPADIDRIKSHQGVVKGYPIQVIYEQNGETVTRGIDMRKDEQGARRCLQSALQSGSAVKVLYQTAKEYHVESAPLPTKERVKNTDNVSKSNNLLDLSTTVDIRQIDEIEPTDPRKYPRRWLVGQYQLALERMGWKWAKGSGMLVNPETHETAPDNPRELIELILGRSLSIRIDTDPDFYDRPSTEYELNARHDWRQGPISEGFTRVVYP